MRVAIAHEGAIARSLGRLIEKAGGHQIAWLARHTLEAMQLAALDRPDVLLVDIDLPQDAVALTRRVMQGNPCPILILTPPPADRTARAFEALGAGAVDVIEWPEAGAGDAYSATGLLLARIQAVTRPKLCKRGPSDVRATSLLVMGASAGGPPALANVLAALPADFPAAVLIAQHIDARFVIQMARWLDTQCLLPVRIAQHGGTLAAGTVLLAGGAHHLTLTSKARVQYCAKPCDRPYHTVIDALFESAATHWTGRLAGVLLTGMGNDGAKGLKRLRDSSAFTIAQDQASSAVYGMPKAAVAGGAAVAILPLKDIASQVTAYFKTPRSIRTFAHE